MLCHATCHCETSGCLMFVQRNVPCRITITVPAVRIHNACSWSPPYMHWERISILLCSRFTTSVPCILLLLRTLRSLVTKLFALVARKCLFCAISSSFHGFTGILFHRIQLLLVFNERCSYSQCQFVSSQLNCTELNEQIYRLCASRNGIPNVLEIVIFLTNCEQNSSSQHTYFHRASPIRRLGRQTVFAA